MSTIHPLSDELLLRTVDGELPPGEAAEVRKHLQACPECLARFRSVQDVSAALAQYSDTVPEPADAVNSRAALLAALREKEIREPMPARSAGWLRMVPALAALVLVTTAVLMWKQPGRRIVSPQPSPVQRASDRAVNPFIALPYSDENLSPEGAVVIQVEVPRSALLLAGMPVTASQADGLVKAEVVLGADGLARAIRFVN
jgi:anti-sigma factor RsiW